MASRKKKSDQPLSGEVLGPDSKAGDDAKQAKRGRGQPPKEINWELVDSLLHIQCTRREVAGVLKCAESTVTDACVREHGISFREYANARRAGGAASLRRVQWDLAVNKQNPRMLIHLGKQVLGQTDKIETSSKQPRLDLNVTVDMGKLSKDALREIVEARKALENQTESEDDE